MDNEKTTANVSKKTRHEPMFRLVKRELYSWKSKLAIRAGAVVAGLLISAVLVTILANKHPNPGAVLVSMFEGAFKTPNRIWNLLQSLVVLLCISLGVTPAFKMKFWNCGAEGQVLMGGLATAACMFYFGDTLPLPILLLTMTLASVIAGAVWALIPAIFKAKWNTNETLFTLMMNYIAIQLVSFAIKLWVTDGSGTLRPMEQYGFPVLFGKRYLLNIIIVALVTVFFFVYFKYSKQGYEIAVVGESEKTARYIGINVKKVILRTMLISGAVCGLAGLILVGATNHTISTTTAGGRGFTAIMVSWLAKFDPLIMILTSFLVVFLGQGATEIESKFRVSSAISDIMVAIILLFIIGSEFFINYTIVFNKPRKEKTDK